MKKVIYALFCILFSNLILAQGSENYTQNQLIIKFKADADYDLKNCLLKQKFRNSVLDALNREYQVEKIKIIGNKKIGDTYILIFKEDQNIEQLIRVYENTFLFEYVEPNYIGTGGGKKASFQTSQDDTYFSRQYGLYNDGTFSLSPAMDDADIDMELAWEIEQGDPSIIVAVLDAGLRMGHPEFAGRIWNNSLEMNDGTDGDDNGFIDDIEGWDFANDDNDPTDDHGHGTNVTGIIGANANNNLGYAGVDWNCKLMVCKILDQNGSGLYSWWTDAIYYAVDNGAKVINMSVGGSGFSNSMQEAVDYAYNGGVTIVACMMNENNQVSYYPAKYQNTIAVGATDASDIRAAPFFWSSESGSNYGAHIDVVAPGNYIYGLSYSSNTNYNSYWGGTSQATPLVTGLSALLLSQDPGRTPDDIRAILRDTAEDQVGDTLEDVEGFDVYYGYGRVNAHQALLESVLSNNQSYGDDSQVSIFPNPSSDYLYVQCEIAFDEISIVNLAGAVLYRKEILSRSELLKIDISDLPKGLYIVSVSEKDTKMIVAKKVVKN
ncbi:MAG: subtilisin family serine protease [Cryomorphaceae bacterium]|jgi:subtilisin family serine protease